MLPKPAIVMQHGHGCILPLLLNIKTVGIEDSEAFLSIGLERIVFGSFSNNLKFLCQDLIETTE